MKKKVLSTVTLYSQRCKSAKELLEKKVLKLSNTRAIP